MEIPVEVRNPEYAIQHVYEEVMFSDDPCPMSIRRILRMVIKLIQINNKFRF